MSVKKKLYFETATDKFYEDHYNNISIIYRESDGYVNATKLCDDFKGTSKRFRDFIH